jgi:hypothetical protein
VNFGSEVCSVLNIVAKSSNIPEDLQSNNLWDVSSDTERATGDNHTLHKPTH